MKCEQKCTFDTLDFNMNIVIELKDLIKISSSYHILQTWEAEQITLATHVHLHLETEAESNLRKVVNNV
jgi:hypothetical protein